MKQATSNRTNLEKHAPALGKRKLRQELLRGTETVFTLLAFDSNSPYAANRPLLAAGQPELREFKCIYVQNDAEIGLFSNEAVVNCAP